METLTVLAFLLLGVGVLGSVLPLVPGPTLSIVGVSLYWWHSGFTEPEPLVLVLLIGLGLLAVGAGVLGSLLGARAGDVPATTGAIAAVAGLLLAPLGPPGIVLGAGGVIYLLEFRRGKNQRDALRGAAFTTLGFLGSAFLQVLLTGAVLFGMLVVAFA